MATVYIKSATPLKAYIVAREPLAHNMLWSGPLGADRADAQDLSSSGSMTSLSASMLREPG